MSYQIKKLQGKFTTFERKGNQNGKKRKKNAVKSKKHKLKKKSDWKLKTQNKKHMAVCIE